MINKKTKHWLHLGWLLILWIHTLRWISCLYHYLLLGHVFRKVNELQWSMLQCSEICLLLLITCVWMDSTYRVAYLVWRILIEWGISCLPKYLCLWEKLWFSMFSYILCSDSWYDLGIHSPSSLWGFAKKLRCFVCKFVDRRGKHEYTWPSL
jgi:hypothetical protein